MSIETTIAKLLAKAEGNTNPHEAESFMAKAEELMLKHGIEQANLESVLPGQKREEIVTVRFRIPNGHGYAAAMADIAHAIAPSFSVRSMQTVLGDSARTVWYIGHKSDVAQAERLSESLLAQCRPQAMHWWKTEGKASQPWASDNDAYLARREFIHAFASGVGSRLRETRSRVVEESAVGTALVLVERSQLVDNWIDENMQTGKARSSSRRTGGHAARSAGREAGRNAVGSPSLGKK
jgi:hypothetical protein